MAGKDEWHVVQHMGHILYTDGTMGIYWTTGNGSAVRDRMPDELFSIFENAVLVKGPKLTSLERELRDLDMGKHPATPTLTAISLLFSERNSFS